MEIQEFIDGCKTGKLKGPSSWSGYAAAAEACGKAQESLAVEAISLSKCPDMYK